MLFKIINYLTYTFQKAMPLAGLELVHLLTSRIDKCQREGRLNSGILVVVGDKLQIQRHVIAIMFVVSLWIEYQSPLVAIVRAGEEYGRDDGLARNFSLAAGTKITEVPGVAYPDRFHLTDHIAIRAVTVVCRDCRWTAAHIARLNMYR